MTLALALPGPGPTMKRDTWDDYLAADAVSSSALQQMCRSPAHYLAYRQGGHPDTPARLLGRATHMLTWEPELYDSHFAVPPKVDRRTKAGKEQYAVFCEALGDRTPIPADQHEEAHRLAAAIREDKTARALLDLAGHTETSIYWCEDGERCKARLDKFAGPFNAGVLLDLKTTRDASPDEFWRQSYKLGYHRQLAWYLRALVRLGYVADRIAVAIIAVEKTPPYCTVVYEPDAALLGRGDSEMQIALDRVRDCKRTNHWPGYATGPVPLELPPWVY